MLCGGSGYRARSFSCGCSNRAKDCSVILVRVTVWRVQCIDNNCLACYSLTRPSRLRSEAKACKPLLTFAQCYGDPKVSSAFASDSAGFALRNPLGELKKGNPDIIFVSSTDKDSSSLVDFVRVAPHSSGCVCVLRPGRVSGGGGQQGR